MRKILYCNKKHPKRKRNREEKQFSSKKMIYSRKNTQFVASGFFKLNFLLIKDYLWLEWSTSRDVVGLTINMKTSSRVVQLRLQKACDQPRSEIRNVLEYFVDWVFQPREWSWKLVNEGYRKRILWIESCFCGLIKKKLRLMQNGQKAS